MSYGATFLVTQDVAFDADDVPAVLDVTRVQVRSGRAKVSWKAELAAKPEIWERAMSPEEAVGKLVSRLQAETAHDDARRCTNCSGALERVRLDGGPDVLRCGDCRLDFPIGDLPDSPVSLREMLETAFNEGFLAGGIMDGDETLAIEADSRRRAVDAILASHGGRREIALDGSRGQLRPR